MTTSYAQQTAFRTRWGDTVGLNADSSWAYAQNTSGSMPVDTTFRVRCEVEEINNKSELVSGNLEYRINSGAYANVTTTSTGFKAVTSSQFTEADPTTNVLTVSSKAFVAGAGSTDGAATNTAIQNQHTEFEYSVQIVGSEVNNNDVINYRLAGIDGWLTTGSIVVYKATPLTVQNGTNLLTSENVALTQHHVLSVNDSSHILSSDNAILALHFDITVDDSQHILNSDNTELLFHMSIVIQNSNHVLSSDNTELTQHYIISVQESTLVLASDNTSLTSHYAITIQDASNILYSENISLGGEENVQNWMLLMVGL